jgi:hypothetical protein
MKVNKPFLAGLAVGVMATGLLLSLTEKVDDATNSAICFDDALDGVVKVETIPAVKYTRLSDGATMSTPENLEEIRKTVKDTITDCPEE